MPETKGSRVDLPLSRYHELLAAEEALSEGKIRIEEVSRYYGTNDTSIFYEGRDEAISILVEDHSAVAAELSRVRHDHELSVQRADSLAHYYAKFAGRHNFRLRTRLFGLQIPAHIKDLLPQ